MSTKGRTGRLSKQITVFTNDKKNPSLKLTISGKVEKFVGINPKIVSLKGAADKKITQIVTIKPEKKYPFKIRGISLQKGKNIRYKLNEIKKAEGTTYLLTVENLKTEKGTYSDEILLKTDSNIQPEIKIKVYGNIADSTLSRNKIPFSNKSKTAN